MKFLIALLMVPALSLAASAPKAKAHKKSHARTVHKSLGHNPSTAKSTPKKPKHK